MATSGGASVGTRLALRGGSSCVRFFFMAISVLLLTRMVVDLLRG